MNSRKSGKSEAPNSHGGTQSAGAKKKPVVWDRVGCDFYATVRCTQCSGVLLESGKYLVECEHTVLIAHTNSGFPGVCDGDLLKKAAELADDDDDEIDVDELDDGSLGGWLMEHRNELVRAAESLYAGQTLVEVYVTGHDDSYCWQTAKVAVDEED